MLDFSVRKFKTIIKLNGVRVVGLQMMTSSVNICSFLFYDCKPYLKLTTKVAVQVFPFAIHVECTEVMNIYMFSS